MKNRPIVGVIVLAIALLLIGGLLIKQKPNIQSDKTAENKSLNLNIIVIDICSLRADHLSFNGYFRPTTPNIDSFAKQSTYFDNFWTSSGWCLPNFASTFTGTSPEVHKMLIPSKSKLATSTPMVQEILRDAGYYTTAGFSGSRYLTEKNGLIRGFDTFENPFPPGSLMPAISFEENQNKVYDWLTNHKADKKPFFLYVTVDDTHSPYYSLNPKMFDPQYQGMLDNVPNTMSESSDLDIAGLFFDRIYNGETIPDPPAKVINDVKEFNKDPKNLYHLIARYDASVNHIDLLVGQILDNIKKNGLFDRSIILITSHQGEQFGEHGLLGHVQGIYEPILRVPLIIRMPSQKEGRRVKELTERIDIPATLLDATGILDKYKNQFIGSSLLPLLKGNEIPWKKYIFASSKPTRIPNDSSPDVEELAVRNSQYKLIWYAYKPNHYELYDIKNDQAETKNLVKSEPKVFEELKEQLDKHKNNFVDK